MKEHARKLLSRVLNACQQFEANLLSVPELQGVVEGILDALEETDKDLSALKWLAAELEIVRFMYPEHKHYSETKQRIERFRSEISTRRLP